MKQNFVRRASCALLIGVLLGGCNRPSAYFQRTSVSSQRSIHPVVVETEAVVTKSGQPEIFREVSPQTSEWHATEKVQQLEAYVRSDNKLSTDKRLIKRIDRMKQLLSGSTAIGSTASTNRSPKMSLAERLMVKKINKKIGKHLAPNKPEKAMINGGLLTGSIILLLVGILLLALTSGGVAVIGLIAAIIGAIGLIFGLLAS